MLNDLGAALLMDFIGVMKAEKNFSSLDMAARANALKKRCGEDYPKVFVDYFSNVKTEDFMKETKEAINVFGAPSYNKEGNQLLNVIAHYLSEEFAEKFDTLDIAFFFSKLNERKKVLEKLFPGTSSLGHTLQDRLIRGTYQELGAAINKALSSIKGSATIVIQSPLELPSALRKDIRSHIIKKYPCSFAEFQVNPQIIGGMRVFVAGRVADHSWLNRIQALTRLSA